MPKPLLARYHASFRSLMFMSPKAWTKTPWACLVFYFESISIYWEEICQMQTDRNISFMMAWLPTFALNVPTEKECKAKPDLCFTVIRKSNKCDPWKKCSTLSGGFDEHSGGPQVGGLPISWHSFGGKGISGSFLVLSTRFVFYFCC